MKSSGPSSGFDQAEDLEAIVVDDDSRDHDQEIRDLVCLAGYLAPTLRHATAVHAAEVVSEWADGDAALIGEAEAVARHEQQTQPAEILHRARDLAAA